MAANNPQKLKKIEQMLDLNERKSKQKESNSEMKTSKIKIIDMTGKEQRVMHGYESLSQMNRQSNLASEKKANTNFDLPELVHNLDLLVNLTEDKILNFDKKLKHTEDVIVNMEYEEKRSKERVKIENEQLDNLKVLLAYIEECEKTVLKQNVTIEELIELFQNLQKNYADEFIIFNLTELAIPLLVPVIKRKMNFWNPLNEFDQDEKNDFNEINFCYDIFSELKSFLNETNYNLKKSNTQIINPYHRIIWEAWMPPFRRIISKVNIRKYSIETVDLINRWSSLLPRWILENICEQIILPKLTNEVDQWNPLTDTIPIQ
jgi:tuftelin-interacting protein 11